MANETKDAPAGAEAPEGPTRADVDARLSGLLAEAEALDRAYAESAFLDEARKLAWLASHPGFSDDENEWEEADGYAILRRAALSGGQP